jgi:hypothetical protein
MDVTLTKIISAINWPGAIILICIFFFIFFRKPISALINRIRSLEKFGVRATMDNVQQKPDDYKTLNAKLDSVGESGESQIINTIKYYSFISAEIYKNAVETDFDKIINRNDDEKKEILLKYAAVTQLQMEFLNIYYLIYGSQINILRHLNSLAMGDTQIALQSFYDNAKKTNPNFPFGYKFEQYMFFLLNHNLINEKNGNFVITEFGRDFLTYIIKAKLPEYKLF